MLNTGVAGFSTALCILIQRNCESSGSSSSSSNSSSGGGGVGSSSSGHSLFQRRKECPLFNSGGMLGRVGADSLSQTVYRNDFLVLVPTLGIRVGT